MATLLIRGRRVLVDGRDVPAVQSHRWTVIRWHRDSKHTSRAYWLVMSTDAACPAHYLWRFLLNAPRDLVVDHRNGNRLDNRRCNLRLCTHSQNRYNSRPQRRPKSARYKGVSAHGDKYKASIVDQRGRRLYLGTFSSPEQAARAYDCAARKHHGEFARVNTP